jgi:ribonuclease P protein component
LPYTPLPRHFYSSKNLRIFFIESGPVGLRISISKKNFKLAVNRNKIKRRIKEIFRTNRLMLENGSFVIMVYKPFAELSFKEASVEVVKAVKSSIHKQVCK